MKIDVFFDAFPHVAKPNMETQLLEWQRQGHHLRVFSLGGIGEASSAFPVTFIRTLRHRPGRLTLGILWRCATQPVRSWRTLRSARNLKGAMKLLARDAQLPSDPSDVNFIHNLAAGIQFCYLKRTQPAVTLAIYYHAGELPGVPQIPAKDAADALQCADIVFSNTQASIDEVVARGAARARTACAPTSFPLERFQQPEGRSRLPGDRWRFVCVGRLSPEKGFDIALRAFATLRRHTSAFDVTIIGGGPELQNLKELTKRLQLLDTVRFLGHVESPQLIPLLAEFDAMILSSVPIPGSNWRETQATVMQEAMLMGTVVVASDIGGVRESLPSVLHPYIYRPGSAEELRERLLSLMALDCEALRALSEVARKFVMEHYDIRRVNEKLLTRLVSLSPKVQDSSDWIP